MAARRRSTGGKSSGRGSNPIFAWIFVLLLLGFLVFMFTEGSKGGSIVAEDWFGLVDKW